MEYMDRTGLFTKGSGQGEKTFPNYRREKKTESARREKFQAAWEGTGLVQLAENWTGSELQEEKSSKMHERKQELFKFLMRDQDPFPVQERNKDPFQSSWYRTDLSQGTGHTLNRTCSSFWRG
jgi:hypothetical protein